MIEIKPRLPKSKQWDMDISPDELFYNHPVVYVDFNKQHHIHGFHGMVLLIPSDKDMEYTKIGIDNIGFTYEGDVSIANTSNAILDELYLVDTPDAISLMLLFQKYLLAAFDLTQAMFHADIDHKCGCAITSGL